MTTAFPRLIAPCLDATDGPALAAFWKEFLGLGYRPGQGPADDPSFIVIDAADETPALAVQQIEVLPPVTWPVGHIPQQIHLDLFVATAEEQQRHVTRALELGADLLDDRRHDRADPLVVMADPAGHPFCLIRPPDPAG